MPQAPQSQPQLQLPPPFLLFRIPVMTIAASTATTTAATMILCQFMKALLSHYLPAPVLALGVFTLRTSSL